MNFSKLFLITLFFAVYACGPTTMKQVATPPTLIGGKLSQPEVTKGLKEALLLGVDKAKEVVSQTNNLDRPANISLPAATKKVTKELAKVKGFEDIEAALLENIANNTRQLVTQTHPVFTRAIKQLNFPDAEKVLMGKGNAATNFFEQTSRKQLAKALHPIIQQTLDQSSLTEHWDAIASNYGKIPFAEKVTLDFSELMTEETMNAMFTIIAKEEVEIRTNKAARSSAILAKVFALQDDNSMAFKK